MNSPASQTTDSASQKAAQELRAAATEGVTSDENALLNAEKKAQLLKKSAAEKAKVFRENASERSGQFKEIAEQQLKEAGEKFRDYHAYSEDYVRENPTKGILVAAAVGFVAGLIIRR